MPKSKTVVRRNERGMTTAEYAVGTLASVSIVGILLKIILSPEFQELLRTLLEWIFSQIQHLVIA